MGDDLSAEDRIMTIHAIYENGVFKPTEEVALPEGCHVTVAPMSEELQKILADVSDADMAGIYEVLSKRFNSGESDVAARHNEHQP
jgi:predicted DNA-binding antitoxin AbrB/MazE fold protein